MAKGELGGLVAVGRVRRPHGVMGEVSVEVLSDNPDRFGSGAELVARRAGGQLERLRVVSARPHRGALLVLFDGFDDRDEVAELRGTELLVEQEQVAEAPEGSYYYFELVGCACTDRRAGDLGEVAQVREDGGGLLLEIRNQSRTLLVPFVREYLLSVDLDEQLIEFDLPDGLLEICASPS